MMQHIAENPRCGVFAAMGSGKTGGTLHGLAGMELMDEGPGLILGPKRVAKNVWPKEAAVWKGLNTEVVPIVGTATERFQALAKDRPWHSINYENLPWLIEHIGQKNWRWKTIVADESTRLKGMRLGQGGKRTRALAKVAWLPQVKRFIELTGTPAPNGLKDLWGQLWYLDQGQRLGNSFEAFKMRWFQRSWDGYGIEPLPHAQEQIQDKIRDICITIDPRDYMTVDDVIERDVVVELPPKAMDEYRRMERQMFLELEHELGTHEVEAVNAAAKTSKCLQIANGAVYYDDTGAFAEIHNAKIEALESIIEEANGMPVLVAYQFKSDLVRLQRAFPQGRYFDDSKETEDAWNAGHIPLMFAHPASAGHGSNLQWGSNILADFSSGWDLEYDDQVIERIGPMRQFQAGLNRPVYRYRILAMGTADFLVKERRLSKRSVQSILLEAMKRRS